MTSAAEPKQECDNHEFAEHIAGQLRSRVKCQSCGKVIEYAAPPAAEPKIENAEPEQVERLIGLLRGAYWQQARDINTRAADLIESQAAEIATLTEKLNAKWQWNEQLATAMKTLKHVAAERDRAVEALRELRDAVDEYSADLVKRHGALITEGLAVATNKADAVLAASLPSGIQTDK